MKYKEVLKNKRFITFLRENYVFKKYKKNFDPKVASQFNMDDPAELINNSFIWHKTPQGSMFWEELSDKWEDVCFSKLEKYLKGIDTESQDVVE
jgi:hypothetical protein